MNKIIIICMALFLTSCVSLEKQFLKDKVKAAELCKIHFPTLEKESKEIIRYKTDTITIKGDSIECPLIYDTIEVVDDGKTEIKYVPVPAKVKCPDSKIIRDTIETEKEVIIKDTSDEVILNDREKQLIEKDYKVKELENKLSKKKKHLFYIYLVISLYVGYNAVKFYIKNKTKL